MNIGIDIDDVITNTAEAIVAYCQHFDINFLGRNGSLTKDKVYTIFNGNKIKQGMNWSDAETEQFARRFHTEVLESVKIKPFAKEIINQLVKDGHTIHIVTARNSAEFLKDPTGMSKRLLKKNGIKFHYCIAECWKKAEYCVNNKIDLFIDDKIETCIDVHNKGIKAFLMNAPHNINIDEGKIKRVFSWPEIYYLIKGVN